jgi:hypothetical protein
MKYDAIVHLSHPAARFYPERVRRHEMRKHRDMVKKYRVAKKKSRNHNFHGIYQQENEWMNE